MKLFFEASEQEKLFIPVSNRKDLDAALSLEASQKQRVIFPYGGLKPSEIYRQNQEWSSLLDHDLKDDRIKEKLELSRDVKVLQRARNQNPRTSVVVPCYEPGVRWAQSYSFWEKVEGDFEIILVDDGSPSSWINEWINRDPERMTLLKLPEKKFKGAHSFRAGLARNAGAALARGENIVFCDSDILVGPDFLSRLNSELEFADVIMPMRWQIHEKVQLSNRTTINFYTDVVLAPGAHWESFQMRETNWNEDPACWRWTSTFCLGMKHDFFLRVGKFRASFLTYGFEDTEWGYRAFLKKGRFQLMPVNTYHSNQPNTHSAYQNSLEKKQELFKISAERFFRHHPQKQVYEVLKPWLD